MYNCYDNDSLIFTPEICKLLSVCTQYTHSTLSIYIYIYIYIYLFILKKGEEEEREREGEERNKER